MKNKIIQFIKKHPFLYNMAKKVNRRLKRMPVKVNYVASVFFYTYIMKDIDELQTIKEHYKKVSKRDTKLLIVVENPDLNKYIHKFIRENTDTLFASLDYFKTYHKGIRANKIILLDHHKDYSQEEILNYLQ